MKRQDTEMAHAGIVDLDLRTSEEVATLLAAGHQDAARAVEGAIGAIAASGELVARVLRAGRKLVYAGAGSSGLMAMADALELPGTYGIDRRQILPLLAGGIASLSDLDGAPEDDVELAERDARSIAEGDCVLCVSASGTTPYVLTVASAGRQRGAHVVAIANNADAPLFMLAEIAILLRTPPEVIGGSTRMGAGTAQKMTFNMISTLAAIRLGHVHDRYMVNLRPDNDKLRRRATHIVADIAGVTPCEASEWIDQADGSVKVAVLLAAGAGDAGAARRMLDRSGQSLRTALLELG